MHFAPLVSDHGVLPGVYRPVIVLLGELFPIGGVRHIPVAGRKRGRGEGRERDAFVLVTLVVEQFQDALERREVHVLEILDEEFPPSLPLHAWKCNE